ncbi:SHOCT domain-containing protein [Caproiciproducens faecalis]|nr:SHOCT domain-containing protein [Caproiciproducens faecalis]
MEDYSLQSDEAVLYKGRATFGNNKTSSELLLTNINIVVITKTKKFFSSEQVDLKSFPVKEIKVYNDVPQIKQHDCMVEIYLTNTEIIFDFYSKIEAYKFANAANKLVSGKSMSERGAKKVKGAVNLVDDTFGISTVGAIKSVVENGVVGAVFGGFGKKAQAQAKGGNALTGVLSVTKGLLGKKTNEEEIPKLETSPAMDVDAQIETLKKLKDLLDTGIITQEEFEIKKKQIMGL